MQDTLKVWGKKIHERKIEWHRYVLTIYWIIHNNVPQQLSYRRKIAKYKTNTGKVDRISGNKTHICQKYITHNIKKKNNRNLYIYWYIQAYSSVWFLFKAQKKYFNVSFSLVFRNFVYIELICMFVFILFSVRAPLMTPKYYKIIDCEKNAQKIYE